MKRLSCLAACAVLLPLAAHAEFVHLEFTGTVVTSTGDAEPVGSTVTGSWTFDSDLGLYSNIYSDPVEGATHAGYLINGQHYGYQGEGWSEPTHFSIFDVYDNGSKRYPALYPSDAVVFQAPRPNADTLLTLLGPDTSFAGSALPTADWLRSGWASGTFSIAGPELGYLMVANINSITVSAVPEPAAAALLLAGLGVLGLLHAGSAARRRRTGTAPDERFTAAY